MKSYNHLNLQQKLLKARKKIPVLMRKHYSEEVDYDFIRLDDINKYLTPALNKYGINLEIVEEKATRTENGNAVYLTQIEGGWMYESDLTIAWVNVDKPEERETATIHLTGTNEMADKAKGTALTYGMKYYLSNRFNINMGGDEDPDYRAADKDTKNDSSGQPKSKESAVKKLEKQSEVNGQSAAKAKTEQAGKELMERHANKEAESPKAKESKITAIHKEVPENKAAGKAAEKGENMQTEAKTGKETAGKKELTPAASEEKPVKAETAKPEDGKRDIAQAGTGKAETEGKAQTTDTPENLQQETSSKQVTQALSPKIQRGMTVRPYMQRENKRN